jgi:hypothetical protein
MVHRMDIVWWTDCIVCFGCFRCRLAVTSINHIEQSRLLYPEAVARYARLLGSPRLLTSSELVGIKALTTYEYGLW